ncbi:hypothetical protein ACS5UA_07440 [Brucella sp. RRSP16]|uniref:hypothetical protein n=1 Tax=Brucella TaxID=234 RepID=UPI0013CEBF09
MEVRVSKAFRAVSEGEVYPRQFEVGETVKGRMAEVARTLGCVADEPAKRKGFERGGGS